MGTHTIGSPSILGLVAVLSVLLCGCGQQTTAMSTSGAIDTGTFPNLNIPPKSAAEPLTAAESAKLQSNVTGAHARQAASGAGAPATSDPTALKKIGAQHGPDTLKAIETN